MPIYIHIWVHLLPNPFPLSCLSRERVLIPGLLLLRRSQPSARSRPTSATLPLLSRRPIIRSLSSPQAGQSPAITEQRLPATWSTGAGDHQGSSLVPSRATSLPEKLAQPRRSSLIAESTSRRLAAFLWLQTNLAPAGLLPPPPAASIAGSTFTFQSREELIFGYIHTKFKAKSCHIIPAIFPTPQAKSLPPPNKVSLLPKLSRAISITCPGDLVSTPEVLDDSVAAFWDYQFLFVSQRSEAAEPVSLRVVEGAIPPDFPCGTYYLTGPGVFTDDHGSTVHPLDGHGYLRAFKFDGVKGEVKFMARYIQTEAQAEERDPVTGRWRFTHRGPFSVLKGGKMVGNTKVMKNVANTSVLSWGGRLFCLWEGGDPYELEPGTLDTIGKFDVIDGQESLPACPPAVAREFRGGVWDVVAAMLKPILYGVFKMPPKRMLSHYKIDARRDRLLIMSCNAEDMLLPRSNFTFYEFDSNFKLLGSREFEIPDHLMIHDWAFTDSHYILVGNRIKLDVSGSMAAVCGLSPMISALSLNPSKPTSPIYLLPRFSDETNNNTGRDWRVPVEAPTQMWVLHVGNAFEEMEENGNVEIQIQASGCSYKWFNFQKMFGYDWQTGKLDPSMMNVREGEEKLLPRLVQVSIALDAKGNCENCSVTPLNQWTKPADFPVINQDFSGSKNAFIYGATSSGSRRALPNFPFDTVVKLNTLDQSIDTWSVSNRRFIGEPIFVPGGGIQEDDGYILVVEYAVSTHRCYLVVLSSKRIGKADAAVARLEVPKSLNFPLGFHGFWAPAP